MQYYSVPAAFTRSFANYAAVGGNPSRLGRSGTVPAVQTWEGTLQQSEPTEVAAIKTVAGWTLSAHHNYDPLTRTVYYGDGSQRSVDANQVLNPVVGEAGTSAGLGEPRALVIGADGSAYVADTQGHRVWRVTPDGTRTPFAGGPGSGGDGGPAAGAH